MTYIIDFDLTCVISPRSQYPLFIADVPHAERVLKRIAEEKKETGEEAKHALILYTMRTDEPLEKAVQWFIDKEIRLNGVNNNPAQTWCDSTKIYGVIIDDYAIGCPKIKINDLWVVNWLKIERCIFGDKSNEDNLREWFLEQFFKISPLNDHLQLPKRKLQDWLKKGKYRHLGDDFEKVENWALTMGYEPYFTHGSFL